MDALIDLSWRGYPAAILIAVGALFALQGTYVFARGFRPPFDGPRRVLGGVRGFRRGIVGLALVGIGAAWIWHIDWILVLSLVIGGEELLESTFHIQALSIAERNHRPRRPARRTPLRAPATPSLPPPTPGDGLSAALVWQGPRRHHGARR